MNTSLDLGEDVVEEESGRAVGQLAELPGGGFDVLLADALHDPLDALLHRRLLLQQLRVRRVRLALPQAVQPISGGTIGDLSERQQLRKLSLGIMLEGLGTG